MEKRREISFSQEDSEYLNINHPGWEGLAERRVVLLHDFTVPEGYNVSKTTAAIFIPSNYPAQALDMVYFSPALARADGIVIPQTQVSEVIDGKTFQRWSRHYTKTKWRPDEDSLATHVMAIRDWLAREFERRSA